MEPKNNNCQCYQLPRVFSDYTTTEIGIDQTNGLFGEVSIQSCKLCNTNWLRYFVEIEGISYSGRWFIALISSTVATTLKAEEALDYLKTVDWYFYGGSYYKSTGAIGYSTIDVFY